MRTKKYTALFSTTVIAAIIAMTFSACDTEQTQERTEPALKDVFADAFMMGAALNRSQVTGQDIRGAELASYHYNAITPENDMKWEVIHPEPGVYNWGPADALVDFAEENDMFITGHTLVWHSQTPDWVFYDDDGNLLNKEALLDRMRNHIREVAGRYKGRVQSWDVVNEALNDDGTMRESYWYQITGMDFLVEAFKTAREVDPEAELYYNDYSLELPEKRDGAIRLVEYLQEHDAPITGIGTQGHFHLDMPTEENIRATLSKFAALGIDVMVTEVDIDVLPRAYDYMGADVSVNVELQEGLNPYPDGLPEYKEQELADRYRQIFDIFLDHKDDITRITFWGVQNGDSWKNNWPVRGRTNYPLIFDRNWGPTLSYDEIVKLAEERLN